MAHAYTPGLKVTENELMSRRRVLPLKGEVLVDNGDKVQPRDVVARTLLPGKVVILNVANKLGVDQSEVPRAMIVKIGDAVTVGQVIGRSASFFGLFTSEVQATMDGTIEAVSAVTGQVVIRGAPRPVEIKAYVEGEVTELIPHEGVIVQACGTYIQGIFGVGGETDGPVEVVVDGPTDVLDPARIGPQHKGKIIVGGSQVTYEGLQRAIEMGVNGIVVGGFDDKDLRQLMGYDLGVAVTGHETFGITLIVTEGFGKVDMAPRTFKLLKRHEGERASINGATQIRAGVIRPEIVIPIRGAKPVKDASYHEGMMEEGSSLRIIRTPWFGELGTVVELPSAQMVLESGSKARVVRVKLRSGEVVTLPRANVELIEGHE